MPQKKKSLPKTFEDLLKDGDLAEIKAVFETCDVNARGGLSKHTALGFIECPDELARWLVGQGADPSAADSRGETPLHAHARSWRGRVDVLLALGADPNAGEGGPGTPLHKAAGSGRYEIARKLLAHGAHVDALNQAGFTPLEDALYRCRNTDIAGVATIAALLLEVGAGKTERMRDFVTRIGTDFEFHRRDFNSGLLKSTSAGLDRLYSMFDMVPVPCRAMHDGKSPIVATASRWEDGHEKLWQLLVPSSGAAETIQGEVIRIAGRIAREIDGNGGANWGASFRKMADAWLAHVGSGRALSPTELAEAAAIVAEIRKHQVGDTERLCELAVHWVACNPTPLALGTPDYDL